MPSASRTSASRSFAFAYATRTIGVTWLILLGFVALRAHRSSPLNKPFFHSDWLRSKETGHSASLGARDHQARPRGTADATAVREAIREVAENDAADAEAICEAVMCPTIRFVPVKRVDQQAALLLHGMRDLLIRQRSSLASAIRAHFSEFGVIVGARIRNVERLLALLKRHAVDLPNIARQMLTVLADQLRDVAARVAAVEAELLSGADRAPSGSVWRRSQVSDRSL